MPALRRDHVRPVLRPRSCEASGWRAGPQLRSCALSVVCTSRMSERMSEDMAEEMSERMSEDVSDRMSEDMSERMSEDMSERISERMSKNECQTECQEKWQKEVGITGSSGGNKMYDVSLTTFTIVSILVLFPFVANLMRASVAAPFS